MPYEDRFPQFLMIVDQNLAIFLNLTSNHTYLIQNLSHSDRKWKWFPENRRERIADREYKILLLKWNTKAQMNITKRAKIPVLGMKDTLCMLMIWRMIEMKCHSENTEQCIYGMFRVFFSKHRFSLSNFFASNKRNH